MAEIGETQNDSDLGMDVTPLVSKGRQVIRSYGSGGFKVNDAAFTGTILIAGDHTQSLAISTLADVTISLLAPLIASDPKPEILIVGTGSRMEQVSSALRQELRTHGIMVECMDTGAACRTYNVLIGEDRRVSALLMAIG